MKLAEALILRAEQQKRLAALGSRMQRNAKVQEGDAPSEDPMILLAEYNTIAAGLVTLIQRINRTNATTALPGHGTIADAIAERDDLRARAEAYRELAYAGMVTQNAYSRSEIRFKSTVAIADLQKQADALSQQHRELDSALQAMNWTVDLVD